MLMMLIYVLDGNEHTVGKKAQTVVVAGKEIAIKGNADKPKCKVMSQDKNAGRCHDMKLIIAPLKDWRSSNIW
jgi:hypothetical protein